MAFQLFVFVLRYTHDEVMLLRQHEVGTLFKKHSVINRLFSFVNDCSRLKIKINYYI